MIWSRTLASIRVRTVIRTLALLTALQVASAPRVVAQSGTLTRIRANCVTDTLDYQLYQPAVAGARPAMLLLHGAGGRSDDVLRHWLPIGERDGVVLVAPEVPRTRRFEAVAPTVFRCIMEDARRSASVDPARIYLFGWSMGGYLSYDAAMQASNYFAGAAVYAAMIDPEFESIVDSAQRKLPIAIYIGAHDQFFSLAQVRRTRDLLIRHGFPVRYTEFPDADHQLYPVADSVTSDAWRWLTSRTRPE